MLSNCTYVQGLFDIDSLRSIHLNFFNSNYDAILQQNYMNGTGGRELAILEMNEHTTVSVCVTRAISPFPLPGDNV